MGKGISKYLKEEYDDNGNIVYEPQVEYVISFNDYNNGELYKQYRGEVISEDKDYTDEIFEELRQAHKLEGVDQYYKKTWEWDPINEDWYETDVEVYFNAGDELEYYTESYGEKKYEVNSYYGLDFNGLEDSLKTADYSEAEDFIWDKLQKGNTVELVDTETGERKRYSSEVQEDGNETIGIEDYLLKEEKVEEDLSSAEEVKLADELIEYLEANQIYPSDVFAADTRVMVEIEWGDWKHDHLRCDDLMKAKGYSLVEEEITEEDGSDCYSAIRHYEPKGKFDNIEENKKTEAKDKFDKGELTAVRDSIDTALDDLQISSNGTVGGFEDLSLRDDLRNVRNFLNRYLVRVGESKKVEGYSLGDDKESFDVFKHTVEFTDKVGKALEELGWKFDKKTYKFEKEDKTIYMEVMQDNVNDLYISSNKIKLVDLVEEFSGYEDIGEDTGIMYYVSTKADDYEAKQLANKIDRCNVITESKKTEAKEMNKKLDYKLDGFKGVNIIVVDKKNDIDTEEYMDFDSMEFGIDEYEFANDMVDGIKDILTDVYEYTDEYYDDRFTDEKIREIANEITQDVLQLYDDLPEENIDRKNGYANLEDIDDELDESKKTESLGDRYEVWQNYYEDGRTTTEYVMSFDNYAEAQKFASGLMQDPDCDAWVKDKEEESKKVTEAKPEENKPLSEHFKTVNKIEVGKVLNDLLKSRGVNTNIYCFEVFTDKDDDYYGYEYTEYVVELVKWKGIDGTPVEEIIRGPVKDGNLKDGNSLVLELEKIYSAVENGEFDKYKEVQPDVGDQEKEIWWKVEKIVDTADSELGPDQEAEYDYDEHIKFVIYRDYEYEDIFAVFVYVDGVEQDREDIRTGEDIHLEDLDATMVDIIKKLQDKEIINESSSLVDKAKALLDLFNEVYDGMGDMYAISEWAELLANDYDLDSETMKDEEIIVTALNEMDNNDFKGEVDNFIYGLYENDSLDYLKETLHIYPRNLKHIIKCLNTIKPYASEPDKIDEAIRELKSVNMNLRTTAKDFAYYLYDNCNPWSVLGSVVGPSHTYVDLFEVPTEYDIVSSDYFNYANMPDDMLENIGYGWKQDGNNIVADLIGFTYSSGEYAAHYDIPPVYYGYSATINSSNKEEKFKEMANKLISKAGEIKKKYKLGESKKIVENNITNEQKEETKQQFISYCEGKVKDLGEVTAIYTWGESALKFDVYLEYNSLELKNIDEPITVKNAKLVVTDDISGVCGIVENNKIIVETGEDYSPDDIALEMRFDKIDTKLYKDILDNWDKGLYTYNMLNGGYKHSVWDKYDPDLYESKKVKTEAQLTTNKVIVYQIEDTENCKYAFMDYDYAEVCNGPDMKDYKKVAEVEIDTRDTDVTYVLDEVFTYGNSSEEYYQENPNARSISVSDILEYQGKKYYVDSFGFREIVENSNKVTENWKYQSLKDMADDNNKEIVKYNAVLDTDTGIENVFDFSEKNGGAVDSFQYYNDYVLVDKRAKKKTEDLCKLEQDDFSMDILNFLVDNDILTMAEYDNMGDVENWKDLYNAGIKKAKELGNEKMANDIAQEINYLYNKERSCIKTESALTEGHKENMEVLDDFTTKVYKTLSDDVTYPEVTVMTDKIKFKNHKTGDKEFTFKLDTDLTEDKKIKVKENYIVWQNDRRTSDLPAIVQKFDTLEQARKFADETDEDYDYSDWVLDENSSNFIEQCIKSGKFYDNQLREILEGFDNGLTMEQVKLYADPQYGWCEMAAIRTGYEWGLTDEQVKLYAKPEFDDNQMFRIRDSFWQDGMTIEQAKVYADPKYDDWGMQQIIWSLQKGLTMEQIQLFANDTFAKDSQKMSEIRGGLADGLTIEQVQVYAQPKFSWQQMKQLKIGLENGLSIEQVKSVANARHSYRQIGQDIYDMIHKSKSDENKKITEAEDLKAKADAVKEKVEKEKADLGLKQAEELVDTENELTDGIKKEIIQYAKQQGLDVEKLQKQGELDTVAEALDNIIGEMVSKSANEFMDTTGKNIEWDFEVKDNNINVIWNEVQN